jgi:hypothetical protein
MPHNGGHESDDHSFFNQLIILGLGLVSRAIFAFLQFVFRKKEKPLPEDTTVVSPDDKPGGC